MTSLGYQCRLGVTQSHKMLMLSIYLSMMLLQNGCQVCDFRRGDLQKFGSSCTRGRREGIVTSLSSCAL